MYSKITGVATSLRKQTLTFDDIPLQEAVYHLFQDVEFVRSEKLLIADAGREWILQKIIKLLPNDLIGHYRFEKILLTVNQFRKMGKDHLAKRLIILEHVRKSKNPDCFYRGKVAGECSEEVDLDRIKPGKRAGEYTIENTVLSCSRHNRERGCRAVELFWKQ